VAPQTLLRGENMKTQNLPTYQALMNKALALEIF